MLNPLDNRQLSTSYTQTNITSIDSPQQATTIPPATNIQYTADNFDDSRQGSSNSGFEQPMLAAPTFALDDPVASQNYRTALVFLQEILKDSYFENRKANNELKGQIATNKAIALNDAIYAVNIAKRNYQQSLSDLEDKNSQLDQAEKALAEKSNGLTNAQLKLSKDKAALDEADKIRANNPNDPQVEEKYQLALTTFNVSQQAFVAAESAQGEAEQARNIAATAAINAAEYAVNCKAEADRCTDDLVISTANSGNLQIDDNDSALLKLRKCIAFLGKLIQEAGTEKLTSDRALNIELQQAIQKKLEDLVEAKKNADEEAQKANATRKHRSKIANSILIALGACLIPFTAGASSVLVVGTTTLAIADQVRADQDKETITGMAMKPLFDKVINPAIQSLVKKIMENTDISEEGAQILANLTVMAAVAVGMAVVSRSATSVTNKIDAIVSEATSKVVKDFLRKFSLNSNASRSLIETSMSVGNITNVGVTSQMKLDISKSDASGKDAEADIVLTSTLLKLVQDAMQSTIRHFCDNFVDNQQDMNNTLTDLANSTRRTIQHMYKNA